MGYKDLEVLGPEHEFSIVSRDLKPQPVSDVLIKKLCVQKKSDRDRASSITSYRFFVTDSADKFREFSSRFLGYEIQNPEIVDITED